VHRQVEQEDADQPEHDRDDDRVALAASRRAAAAE
jgi:hypothetical protein